MPDHSVFTKFPVLAVNDEVILRDFIADDVEHYYRLLHHPDVKTYIPTEFLPKNLTTCAQELHFLSNLFHSRNSIYWAIARRNDNQLIGTCGFEQWLRRHNRLEIAYELHPYHWGHGIASQSVKTIINFGFDHMKANRIDAYTLKENLASMKLLVGLGFQQEGILKQFRHFNGQYRDIALFCLLSSDHTPDSSKWVRHLLNRWR